MPPSWWTPTLKETRVRVDGLLKMSAMVLPARTSPRGERFQRAGPVEDMLELPVRLRSVTLRKCRTGAARAHDSVLSSARAVASSSRKPPTRSISSSETISGGRKRSGSVGGGVQEDPGIERRGHARPGPAAGQVDGRHEAQTTDIRGQRR